MNQSRFQEKMNQSRFQEKNQKGIILKQMAHHNATVVLIDISAFQYTKGYHSMIINYDNLSCDKLLYLYYVILIDTHITSCYIINMLHPPYKIKYPTHKKRKVAYIITEVIYINEVSHPHISWEVL